MNLNFCSSEIDSSLLRVNRETGELAVGVRVPKSEYFNNPVKFLEKSKRLQVTDETNILEQMELSQKLYHSEDIIGASIDRMVEFATTGITIEETNKEPLNNIFKYFERNLNSKVNITSTGLKPFVKQFLQEYLISGNVFPYEYWRITNGLFNPAGNFMDKSFTIPESIVTLNPTKVSIDSSALEWGIQRISINLDDNTVNLLLRDGRIYREIMPFKRLLKRSQLKRFKSKNQDNNINIDSRLISHIKRKASHYKIWGVPFLSRSFDAISQIHQMREMDRSVIDGLIRSIILLKVGSDEFPATQRRLDALKNLFSNPKIQEIIAWPHDISHELIQPDSKVLQYKDKYRESYDRLFIALGVPPILLGREYHGDAEVAVSAFAETLRDLQEVIIEYVEYILKKIAENNGYMGINPKVRMETVNVNKLKQWTGLRDAYMTGIISKKQYNEGIGFNYWETIELKKKENKEDIGELFMPPAQPFQGEQTVKKDGRPPESTNQDTEDEKITQLKKRDKQAASIYEIYNERLISHAKRIVDSKNDDDFDYAMILLESEVKDICKSEKKNYEEIVPKLNYFKTKFKDNSDENMIVASIFKLIGV